MFLKEERDDHENMFLYLLSLSTLEMIWDREVAPATTEVNRLLLPTSHAGFTGTNYLLQKYDNITY